MQFTVQTFAGSVNVDVSERDGFVFEPRDGEIVPLYTRHDEMVWIDGGEVIGLYRWIGDA